MAVFLVVYLVEHSSQYPHSRCLELFFHTLYHPGARHALPYHYYSSVTILCYNCRIYGSSYRCTVYNYIVKVLLAEIKKLLKVFFLENLCRIRHRRPCKYHKKARYFRAIHHFLKTSLTGKIVRQSAYLPSTCRCGTQTPCKH